MSKRLRKIFPVLCGTLLCVGIPMKVSAASVSAVDTDGTEKVFQLSMSQPGVSNMSEALFAVWGDVNGQDDLKWYQAQPMSDGSYRCNVAAADHGQTGRYTVHAYAAGADGSMTYLGDTSFQVSTVAAAATASARSVTTANYNASTGTFQAWVQGIQAPSGVSQVSIPVWCAADQSDIVWYNASRMSDGSYMAEISIANHGNHTGDYQIHAYVSENSGAFTMVGATAQNVSAASSSTGSLSIYEKDGGASYQIDLNGTQIPGMYGVRIGVWADQGGQDDFRWYDAAKSSNGGYTCTVPISNHGQNGRYNAHAYALLSNGSVQLLDMKTFDVSSAVSAALAKVQVTNVNTSAGTFDIVVSNAVAAGGVRSVQVPVWHAADQSDILWYTAQSQGNGTYKVTADVANHKYNTGEYNIHVYLTTNSGVMSCICGTTANINVSTVSNKVQASKVSESQYRVSLSAPQVSGSNSKVLFPTWSVENGQDDIIWYEGVRSSDGVWYVDVDGRRHNSTGTYTTHAYIQNNGACTFVGAVDYTMNFSVQSSGSRVANDANGIIGSITNSSMDSGTKLRTCYNWVVNNISYQTLPNPLTPSEPGYTQEEWYAIYGLEQRRGNCYCYAAAFAAMARQLGYNATMISGSVPLLAGGMGPHAWVEIYMNGATYICDPESQHENPSYMFYMTTYATAPYRYQK